MMEKKFLIDSNALMTPYLSFYPFDFAPTFWEQLGCHIKNGSIVILDMVKREVMAGTDSLSHWMKNLEVKSLIDHRDPHIFAKYSEVLEHVQNSPCYKASALTEWAKAGVADPWLIATASVNHLTIVTFEKSNPGLSQRNPGKNAKIPDVASFFDVEVQNLYYMMRYLGFHL